MIAGTNARAVHRLAKAVALAVFMLALIGIATACGDAADERPAAPDGEPDITGVVSGAESVTNGEAVRAFLIDQGTGPYDKASVTVTVKTGWFSRSGDGFEAVDTPTVGELTGKTVAVQFTGAVAESYPVQATAGWVVVSD